MTVILGFLIILKCNFVGGNAADLFERKQTMNNTAMFSSKHECWETPQDLFDYWDKQFHFTLDVAANESNHKCDQYFTPEIDGLKQEWSGVVWCNPPYGRNISKWVRKAWFSQNTATIVMLLPARTDTKWFHEYIDGLADHVIFIKGRLKFSGCKNSAPFPSMIVIYYKKGEQQ